MNSRGISVSLEVHDKAQKASIMAFLALVSFLAFSRILSNGFTNFDDTQYITSNLHVTGGLSWQAAKWAFTSGYAGNWHPLTWISHMLACQLFGLNPAGHHLIDLLLHVTNSCLVFALLHALTGSYWRSTAVAALFALHPMHVESVAWASERKDVLSGFLYLLTLLSYVRYVRKPSPRYYAATLLCFALGLMAKPMVVTLPFVLLLLDFWPLERWRSESGAPFSRSSTLRAALRLVIEKIPFFLLTALACIVTFSVQKSAGAVSSSQILPLHVRLANVVVSYVRYLSKAFWPDDLCCMYLFNEKLGIGLVAGCAVLLLLITVLALQSRSVFPFFTVGWLWFLGTLVPTIGIVQVGSQAMADRYFYIPSIGLFFATVWGVAACLSERLEIARIKRAAFVGLAALFTILGFRSDIQIRTWHDGQTLFSNALRVGGPNYFVWYGLGGALYEQGKVDEALKAYQNSVTLNDGFADAHANLAKCLLTAGETNFAEVHMVRALKLKPADPELYYNYGTLLLIRSDFAGAQKTLESALRLRPDYSEALVNLGICLVRTGEVADAARKFCEAAQVSPNNADAHRNLGMALLQLGAPEKAAQCFAQAVRLRPGEADSRYHLALSLSKAKGETQALREAEQALQNARAAGQEDLAKKAEELVVALQTHKGA